MLVEPERSGDEIGARPAVEQALHQVAVPRGSRATAADEVPGRDAGRADEHVLGARRERLRALLHPDRAQRARARVDADRQPAPDAELGVLVDAHDLLARAQPVEHAPFAQVAQVVRGTLPAEDGQPAQLVDLAVVAVGAGVGEHPAGRVLDADDAVGEQGDGLGEREQVVGPRALARVEHACGERLQALPADVRRHGEQRDARLDRRAPGTASASFTATAAAPAAPAARTSGTASRPRAPTTRTRPPLWSSGSSSGSTMARPLIGTSRPAGAATTVTSGSPTAARRWRNVLIVVPFHDSERPTLADRTSPRRSSTPTVAAC